MTRPPAIVAYYLFGKPIAEASNDLLIAWGVTVLRRYRGLIAARWVVTTDDLTSVVDAWFAYQEERERRGLSVEFLPL